MRKFLIFSVVFLCMGMAACQKNEQNVADVTPEIVNEEASVFRATVQDTKTYLTGEVSTHWAVNDWISILKGENNYGYGTADYGASATFSYAESGDAPEGIISTNTWALYPYSATATLNGSVITTWLSEDQQLMLGAFSDQHPLLVARSDSQGNLHFKQASAVLKFTVTEEEAMTSLWLKGNAGEKIAGAYEISYDGSTLSAQVADNNGDAYDDTREQLNLTPAGGGTLAAGTYYTTVAPATFSEGLKLEWPDPSYASGKVPVLKSTSEFSFEAGKIYDLGTLAKSSDTAVPAATLLSAPTASKDVPYTLRIRFSDNLKLGAKAGLLITDTAWSSYFTGIWDHSASVSSNGNYYEFYTDGSDNWIFETTVTFTEAGSYVVGTELYDYAGNGAWPSMNINVTDPMISDTEAPSITLNSASTAKVGTAYELSITFADASGMNTQWPEIKVYRNGEGEDWTTAMESQWPPVSGTSYTFTNSFTFPKAGTYLVYIGSVSDKLGNSTSVGSAFSITVTEI